MLAPGPSSESLLSEEIDLLLLYFTLFCIWFACYWPGLCGRTALLMGALPGLRAEFVAAYWL